MLSIIVLDKYKRVFHLYLPPAYLFVGCNSKAESNPNTVGAVFFNTPPNSCFSFLYGSRPTYRSWNDAKAFSLVEWKIASRDSEWARSGQNLCLMQGQKSRL
jgi:hypothetical protein